MKKKYHIKSPIEFFTVVVIIVAILIVAIVYTYVNNAAKPLDKGSKEQIAVNIKQGSSTYDIGKELEKRGVIKKAKGFKLWSRIKKNDGKYKAGAYILSPSMSADEIMKILISGKQDFIRVTIPEGYSLKDIAAKFQEKGICTADEFIKETQEGDFDRDCIAAMLSGENRMEGFLFPATYDVTKNMPVHQIIDDMLKTFDNEYANCFNKLSNELKYNTLETVTIASLIENEARLDNERKTISSVIYNRLDRGMKLKIDATVQYALGTHKKRLYNSDLKVDSPYNTYKVPGLPVGPICSPGRTSLMAAMEPENSNYLYYVLSKDRNGSHKFAETSAEFDKYAREYWDSLK